MENFEYVGQPLVRCNGSPFLGRVELLIFERRDGFRYVGKNVVMERQNEGEIIEPTVSISYEAAQQLIDDLWVAGLRPTDGAGTAGAMRATERHLADLQKLIFENENRPFMPLQSDSSR